MKRYLLLLFTAAWLITACGKAPTSDSNRPAARAFSAERMQQPTRTSMSLPATSQVETPGAINSLGQDPLSCDSERQTGTVKWFENDKGYGYIARNGDVDVFVHFSEIIDEGFRTLQAGQTVEFCAKETPKGIQAFDVLVLKP